MTGTAHRAFNHIERLNRRLARFTRGFACFFLWSRFCLIVFPADFDTGVAVVGQHIDNNTGYHFLQLVNKLRGLEIATLYTAQLVFPYACKLGTFKQILVNNANEVYACLCRQYVFSLTAQIVPLEKGFDNGGTGRRASDAVFFHSLAKSLVVNEFARAFHCPEQRAFGIWLWGLCRFLLQ